MTDPQLHYSDEERRVLKFGFKRTVNVMTNHMRNLWARAGYPGLRKKNPFGPAGFISATLLDYRMEKANV